MFIVLPISHEDMEAERFPYVTLAIILLNTLIFIATTVSMIQLSEKYSERETALVRYYVESYAIELYALELPEETFAKLSPESQAYILETVRYTQEMTITPGYNDRERQEAFQEAQEHLDRLVEAFEEAYGDNVIQKYGYVPAHGGIATIFSSLFLHGGLMHLFGNMLFLWLSGCNIEDRWGRIIYPIFYLIGGILAALAHGAMYPDSTIPLIGASGAIATVMGAFTIRMYATKIHLVYFMFIGFRFLRGRFAVPAYVVLPFWFLQQFWGVLMGQQGVAFWAHIGGFVFGAVIATLMKISGIETHVIAPALEKKTAVVDEHLASGVEKFRDQDIEGAIRDLKLALKSNPDDPIAHNELSKAYFARGDKQLALREFKRAIFLYMKRGEMNQAVDEYLELHAEMPELMLDPPQQKKLAAALEKRAKTEMHQHSEPEEGQQQQQHLYAEAAFAYKQLIFHYRKTTKRLQHPNAVNALKCYIHLNINHLQNPQEAAKAYKTLLKTQAPLSQEERQQLEESIKTAKQEAVQRDKQAKLAEAEEAQQAARMQHEAELASQRRAARAKIPLRKRVKLLPAIDAPAKYPVPSIAPLDAGKVIPAEGGLDLKRLSEPPIGFDYIYLLHVFQLQENTAGKRKKRRDMGFVASESLQDILFVDLFLKGRSRPYRIASNRIAYPQFFSNLQPNSLDNFRQFISYIISYLESLYLDQQTINFLKTGKAVIFSDQEQIAIHEKILWKQLRGAVRFVCDHCFTTYWADGNKIPANGAETTCPNCKQSIFVEPVNLTQGQH